MKRPVIFFLALMVIAAAVIVFYLQFTNPQHKAADENKQAAGSGRAYNKELAFELYQENCADCHGRDGRGIMSNPALTGTRFSETQIISIIQNGLGAMPAIDDLDENQMHQIAHFVKHLNN